MSKAFENERYEVREEMGCSIPEAMINDAFHLPNPVTVTVVDKQTGESGSATSTNRDQAQRDAITDLELQKLSDQ